MIYQYERSEIKRCDGCDFFFGGVDGMSYEWGYCTRQEDIIDGHKTPQENNCPLVAISKTETTSCEWCEGNVSKYFDVNWYDFNGHERLDKSNYCPACGRKMD